jgi:predicted Zn-ribbon and HTH transcriptional regulator
MQASACLISFEEVSMSTNPDSFRRTNASSRQPSSDDFDEPPIRRDMIEEPPIRSEEPPPSRQELDAAAADELLRIAAEEERDLQKLRKTQQSKDTFLIVCPNGCRIRVKEQHRGRSGKCPRCQAEFVVPKKGSADKDSHG